MTKFIKKYDGVTMLDAGSYVSREFSNFQNAMKRELKRLAEEIGANLVSFSKGHYDMSWFVEREGHFVYGSYSNFGDRAKANLTGSDSFIAPCYVRTAAHAKDYRGGSNNHCTFAQVQELMDKLLNQEHIRV